MGFSGQKKATFDEKGRVVLPADFKSKMGGSIPDGQLAIEIDVYEKCLNIYPIAEWEKRIAGIKAKLNPNIKEHSRLLDMFYRNFTIIQVPETCRMNIPGDFMEKVGLKKDVIFTSQGDRIRLWDLTEYNKYVDSLSDDYESIYARLLGHEEI